MCACMKLLSHVWLFAIPWTVACQLLHPWNFPGKSMEWVAISFSISCIYELNYCKNNFTILMYKSGYQMYFNFIYLFIIKNITYPQNYTNQHFSSVAQSCQTLCDPMNRSTPGLPVHHQLPEFTQPHVHHREGNGTPTPVLLPGKSHGWRSLVGCSPWGH